MSLVPALGTAGPLYALTINDTLELLLERVLPVDLALYCEGDGTDEADALQQAVNDAAASGRPLHHPRNLSVYVKNHVTQMPDGLFYFGEGELWTDATAGDGVPQAAFAFLENEGWQTSDAGEDITVVGIRFRRTTDVAGAAEGPYDRAIRLRGCTGVKIDITTTGGLGGVLVQGCDDYEVKGTFCNVGDAGVSTDGTWGATACKNGRIDAIVYNSGYLLDGTTPVPTGIAGSAVVCTQSGSHVKVRAINPRHNALETGDGATNLDLDVEAYVDIDGRVGDALIANCSDVTVRYQAELHNGGKGMVNVVGASGQAQHDIRVLQPVGTNDHAAAGFENYLVTVGAHSHKVLVDRPVARGMTAVYLNPGTGGDIEDVDLVDMYSIDAPRFGAYIGAGVLRTRVRGGAAHRPGQDSAAAGPFRAGLVVDQAGAGCSVEGFRAYDDGAGTMQWGYYVEGSSVLWGDNQSVGHVVGAILKGGGPTLTAPTPVS